MIKSKLELLPTSPGCYIHKDKNGTIIYVGKAKNLRNPHQGEQAQVQYHAQGR